MDHYSTHEHSLPDLGPDYVVQQLLGKGADGKVYRARYQGSDIGDLKTGTDVAVKLLEASRIRKDEVLLQASLSHKNIIRLFDVFRSGWYLAIVMELADHLTSGLPGPNLWDCMERPVRTNLEIRVYGTIVDGAPDEHGNPRNFELPIRGGEPMMRWIFMQIACALDYLHRHPRRLCNRDVKPQNVLVCGLCQQPDLRMRPVIKLADFGFVRATDSSDATTRLGTPNYAAPEVLTLQSGQSYDGTKADVWSAGCVLYVIATGLEPFRERGDPALWRNQANYARVIVDRIADKRGAALSRLWERHRVSHCSAELMDLLRAMLEPDPERRLTMRQVLLHPWLKKMDTDLVYMDEQLGKKVYMPVHASMVHYADAAAAAAAADTGTDAAAAASDAAALAARRSSTGWNFPHKSAAEVLEIIQSVCVRRPLQTEPAEAAAGANGLGQRSAVTGARGGETVRPGDGAGRGPPMDRGGGPSTRGETAGHGVAAETESSGAATTTQCDVRMDGPAGEHRGGTGSHEVGSSGGMQCDGAA